MTVVLTGEQIRQVQRDERRRATKKALILAALRSAGPAGRTNSELNALTFRYTGRVAELRDEGYVIDSVDEGEGRWRFVLRMADPQPQPGGRTKQPRQPRRDVWGPVADRIVSEAARILSARGRDVRQRRRASASLLF